VSSSHARSSCGPCGGEVTVYLVDFEQRLLISLHDDEVLDIDGTVAGRSFRVEQVAVTPMDDGGSRAWVPLLNGADRQARF